MQVSYDGVPFLLHDPHTIRTTDVKSKCPDVDPLANATWLNYTTGTCPLEELNVGSWFINEVNLSLSLSLSLSLWSIISEVV